MAFKNTGNRSTHEKKHKVNPQYNCRIKKKSVTIETVKNDQNVSYEQDESYEERLNTKAEMKGQMQNDREKSS